MRIPSPVTLHGFTGADKELSIDAFREKLFALEKERHPAGYPNEEVQTHARGWMFDEIVSAHSVAEYHNGILKLIAAYQAAERKVHAAKHAAGAAYEELTERTTTAWHAAHHRYIVAIHNAEPAFAELAEAATHLVEFHTGKWRGVVASFYNQHVPAERRLDVAALDQIAERDTDHELALFREQHRANLHLLSYTISGGVPAGYEPDPVPTEPEAEPEYVSPYRTRDW